MRWMLLPTELAVPLREIRFLPDFDAVLLLGAIRHLTLLD